MLMTLCPAAMQAAPLCPGLELPALQRWRAPPWHPHPGDGVWPIPTPARAVGPGDRSRPDGLVCYSSVVKKKLLIVGKKLVVDNIKKRNNHRA